MKLKILSIFLFVFLFEFTRTITKTCKTKLLRSFNLHSRITPDRSNAMCPEISWNCCTQHDQMKLHKMWHHHSEHFITRYYDKSKLKFLDYVSKFIGKVDMIKLTEVLDLFKKEEPKPSTELLDHLFDLKIEFEKKKMKELNVLAVLVKSQAPVYAKYMKNLR